MIRTLDIKQVIAINTYLIKKDSPGEIIGIKEPGALQMTMESIHLTAFGEEVYPTLEEKAAILFINLSKKHCFHNANKRTAYMSLNLFIHLNNLEFKMETNEAIEWTVGVATHSGDFDELKEEVVRVIQAHTNRID